MRLFENQNALDDESLKSYAEEIGLDAEKFAEDLESGKFEEKVQADFMSGVESGVNGTPSHFLSTAFVTTVRSITKVCSKP